MMYVSVELCYILIYFVFSCFFLLIIVLLLSFLLRRIKLNIYLNRFEFWCHFNRDSVLRQCDRREKNKV